jgi:hypothetical protein
MKLRGFTWTAPAVQHIDYSVKTPDSSMQDP